MKAIDSAASTGAIFPKLSSGPGGPSPDKVALHQSGRLKGAMVEAVSRHGYSGTTLTELVTLAGVSKSTFYQHFGSKQECFLATFDDIIAVLEARVGEAYRSGDDFRDRLERSLDTFVRTAVDEPAAATLTAVEVLTLGAPGVEHSERASRTFEALVQQSFDHSPAPTEVSPTIVRGIVAGIKGVTYRYLRAGRSEELPGLVGELVDWALSYQRPPGEMTLRAMSVSEAPWPGDLPDNPGDERPGWKEPPDSRRSRATLTQRERIIRAATRVAVERGYETLSIPTITSAAGVSNQTFYEHFESKREAFLSAFESFGTEVLAKASVAYMQAGDFAEAIGAGTRVMLEQVAGNELLARLTFFELPAAGPMALDRADGVLDTFAALLRPDAFPGPKPDSRSLPQPLLQAIPSGVWAVVQHEIANGRLESLPEIAPEVARIAIAPFDATGST